MQKSFTVFILSISLFFSSFEVESQWVINRGFTINDTIISDTLSSLPDPEIDQLGRHFCWAGPEGIWVGDIDPVTGLFFTETGQDYVIDTNIAALYETIINGAGV